MPHAPQLLASEARVTQDPEQLVCPEEQTVAQFPPVHAVPLGQTFPQLPQFFPSELTLTHVPPQLVSPDAHAVWTQEPEVQTSPEGQTLPQDPQF